MFCELVVSCSKCVVDHYPLAVRIAGCKILTIFLRKIEKHSLQMSVEEIGSIRRNKVGEGIMSI